MIRLPQYLTSPLYISLRQIHPPFYIYQLPLSMSLKKTETQDLGQPQVWAKLIPIPNSQPLTNYSLSTSKVLIGRNTECDICINDKRLSGKHCLISKENDKITITDLSTNGTFLGDKKIGKNITIELNHLHEIWLLNASKVAPIETIGLVFNLSSKKDAEINKISEEQAKKKQQQQLQRLKEQQKKGEQLAKKRQQQQKKKKDTLALNENFAKSIKDQITCSFCYEIMSIPVAIQPCNHRFCGGCLTELVNNKKDACIQCRKEITTAVRDAAFTSIIQDYLKGHPQEKRDPKEEEELKSKNIFGFDPINIHQRIHGKPKVAAKKAEKVVPAVRGRSRGRALVRASSDLSASDDDQADKCRECVAARDGFQCSATQVHVGCHNCGKLVPQRNDPTLHQSCSICTTFYCNLYYPPCKAGTKLTLLQGKRQDCKIDAALMRGNEFQFQSIRNYLLSKKMNSKDIFDHMLKHISTDKFSYLMDRKIMKVPPLVPKEVKLKADSAICDLCWNDLWFQMVFAYRIEIVGQLPPAVRDRPTCYWGINCRTSDHNKDHAKKYNHCVYQTRFA